ncbi:hypothetical protein Pmar_PMAR009514 [Perkinsus marinus ATCC 50983]|uniref:C3H1-type domain-containing protein n=1 Tax=Perkinsus marinus (strain ATCC 50983 / TXsc) TaxID=423536 RepID=C5KEE2_PERM5|nr:hypothetical protein Pmar_PMAR009514 [Perkinsus marinus ATCC 50983]EER17080.1 hypothetical protein Pmar_PMAR009514 [Perkinsus marinus ATCC 50983]|eukprot:XP_002785284.1 hypothetical protein Pmar_PMAR009514 [Perkinsus marinus ATCC 50983]
MKSISRLDIRHEASSAVDAFKVELCPKEQVHDRKVCPFYHNYRDRRRYPITYKAEQCPQHFEVDSNVMSCDKGDHCSKRHSRLELLYHPTIFKQRFCATWPNVSNCVRARQCAFAHDRSEINGKMFTEEQEARKGIDFFVNHFKTLWCPYGVQHDWHRCYYAHTYQDCRSCDWKSRGKCPRGELCAFYHHTSERRTSKRVTMLDYNQPLSIGDLLHEHQPHFWRPPLFSADDSTSMATRGIGRVRSYSSGTDSDASTVLPMVASTSSWGVHRSDSGSVTTTAPGSTELHPQLCSSYASIPIFILPPSVAYGPRQSEAVPEGEDHSVGGMAENDFRFVDEEDNTLDVRM